MFFEHLGEVFKVEIDWRTYIVVANDAVAFFWVVVNCRTTGMADIKNSDAILGRANVVIA